MAGLVTGTVLRLFNLAAAAWMVGILVTSPELPWGLALFTAVLGAWNVFAAVLFCEREPIVQPPPRSRLEALIRAEGCGPVGVRD